MSQTRNVYKVNKVNRVKILTISSLYPNNEDPKHGIFVENRLRQLKSHYPEVAVNVIAPVPWFPIKSKYFSEYAKFVDVHSIEERHGITVYHPRYLVIPKIGMLLTPLMMAISLFFCVKEVIKKEGRPNLIDGHYFYPDGVAIALIAKYFDLPFTCTSRGTDINLIADMPLPQKMIKWTIKRASKCMAVCQALTDKLVELGAKDAQTLRNGVDLDFFHPLEETSRQQLKTDYSVPIDPNIPRQQAPLLLSVGWLIERKGHYLAIEALTALPNATLLIAGNGPDLNTLKQQVSNLDLSERVVFLGALDQETLRCYYQMADALILGSSREGWANVLLESMACGTPVVATNIWGTPEVVKTKDAGILVERSPEAIAQGINALLSDYPNRQETRRYAEQFDWQSTSDGQVEIFKHIHDHSRSQSVK